MSDRSMSDLSQRTLAGVFAPTVLALVPVVPLVALPMAGWYGTVNLLVAIGLAAVVAAGTALCMSSGATDAPPGAQPSDLLLARTLGRGVGAAVALPVAIARPMLAALAVVAARQVVLSLGDLGLERGSALLLDLGGIALLALIAFAVPAAIERSRLAVLGVLALAVLSAIVGAALAPFDPSWIPAERLDPAAVLALAVVALVPLPGGADGTARLETPRRSFPAGTLWAVGVAAALALLVALDPTSFQAGVELGVTGLISRVALLLALLWTGAAALAGARASVDEAVTEGWFPAEPSPVVSIGAALGVAILAVLGGDLVSIAWGLAVVLLLAAIGIDLAVLLPLWLKLPSFRPTLRLPLLVPIAAILAAGLALALLAPATAVLGLVGMGALYVRGERTAAREDERSALLAALLTRATATDAAQEAARAWTPRILVPLATPALDADERAFLEEAVRPEGALHLLGVADAPSGTPRLEADLDDVVGVRRADGIAATRSVLSAGSLLDGAAAALQVLQGTFPAPGLVYVRQPDVPIPDLGRLVETARHARVGVLWLDLHPEATLGVRRSVNLWVRPHVEGWEARQSFELGHVDLALLTCLRLQRNLGVRVTLVAAVDGEAELPRAHAFLAELAALGRLPDHATRTVALVGELPAALGAAPPADLHVLGLPPDPEPDFVRRLRDAVGASVLLVGGSGRESARA